MEERSYQTKDPSSQPAYKREQPLLYQNVNPRFCLTPESMGVQLPESIRPTSRLLVENPQAPQYADNLQTLYRRNLTEHDRKRRLTPCTFPENSSEMENGEEDEKAIQTLYTLDARNARKPSTSTTSSMDKFYSLCSASTYKLLAEDAAGKKPWKTSELPGSDTATINAKLNDIFVKRLEEIECNNYENTELELLTYKEWVDMLLKINKCIIRNTEELEAQIAARLGNMCQQQTTFDCHQNRDIELHKHHNDIISLTKIIQNAYCNNNWDLANLQLETISKEQIFGGDGKLQPPIPETQTQNKNFDAEINEKNKMLKAYEEGMKALASEVAEKHDEMQMLKKHLAHVEEEVELSRQKVEMKETTIYQLRHAVEVAYTNAIIDIDSTINDWNANAYDNNTKASENTSALPRSTLDVYSLMPPVNSESHTAGPDSTMQASDCTALKFVDDITQLNLLKSFEEEPQDYFKLNEECNKQNVEKQGKRLWGKWKTEKAEPNSKLELLRQKLIDLELDDIEGNSNECISNGSDPDIRIIKSVRSRLSKLKETTSDLRRKVQKLELENNELATSLKAEKNLSECSSQALKEIADQLHDIIVDKQFSYADIYNSNSATNPFCEAIKEIINEFHKSENELLHVIAAKNTQITDLSNVLRQQRGELHHTRRDQMGLDQHQHQHQSCLHLEAVVQYCDDQKTDCIAATCNIINELKSDLDLILCEALVVQQMCDTHIDDNTNSFEDVLDNAFFDMQMQNVKLEESLKLLSAEKNLEFVKLQLHNETLMRQIEHLQHMVMEGEKRIMQLTTMNSRRGMLTNAVEHKKFHDSQTLISHLEKQVKDLTEELEKCQKDATFLHAETRKLNEELNENKRKNETLNSQNHNLAALLKSQETHRLELASKYEILENNYTDQAKQLGTTHVQLNTMKERIQEMEKKQCEHHMERKLLHEEVLSLKQKEADLMGKQRSMQEQVLKSEKELYSAHDVIREQQAILQQEEISHKEAIKRLHDLNADMKNRLTRLMNDYKRLQVENEKLEETCRNNKKLLESFRKWKDAQLKSEERTRETFKQYEENIRLLLQEKQRYVEQYRSLDRDYIAIQNELDRLNICPISMSRNDFRGNNDNSLAECYQVMRQTTDCITGQYNALHQEAYLSAYDSGMNNEDPL